MTGSPRPCRDCSTDISHRAPQARRCETCSEAERWAGRRRPPNRAPRFCVSCNGDITARAPMAKRCEPCVALAAAERLRRNNANLRPRPYACHHCGTEFLRQRTDTLYCRRSCWGAAQTAARQAARPTHVCGWCGGGFRPVRSDAVYCRRECGAAAGYAANPERRKAQATAWVAANPERRRAIAAGDKARRKSALGPGVRSADWVRLLRRYGGRCAYCGSKPDVVHMEHVVPLSRGGRHAIGNVVPACEGCNLSKHDDLLVEWRRRRARAARVATMRPAVARRIEAAR